MARGGAGRRKGNGPDLRALGPFENPNAPSGPGTGIPAGGVILEAQQPLTQHQTVFQSCSIDLAAIVSEQGIVQGYQVVIEDRHERRKYVFQFDQNLMSLLRPKWAEIPDVGEAIPEERGGA